MEMQTGQQELPLPTCSREDAENQVRQAAEVYKLEQSEANRNLLGEAVWSLRQFDPPIQEWNGWAPSHRFMLSLMPDELKWPDPLCGETLFR